MKTYLSVILGYPEYPITLDSESREITHNTQVLCKLSIGEKNDLTYISKGFYRSGSEVLIFQKDGTLFKQKVANLEFMKPEALHYANDHFFVHKPDGSIICWTSNNEMAIFANIAKDSGNLTYSELGNGYKNGFEVKGLDDTSDYLLYLQDKPIALVSLKHQDGNPKVIFGSKFCFDKDFAVVTYRVRDKCEMLSLHYGGIVNINNIFTPYKQSLPIVCEKQNQGLYIDNNEKENFGGTTGYIYLSDGLLNPVQEWFITENSSNGNVFIKVNL